MRSSRLESDNPRKCCSAFLTASNWGTRSALTSSHSKTISLWCTEGGSLGSVQRLTRQLRSCLWKSQLCLQVPCRHFARLGQATPTPTPLKLNVNAISSFSQRAISAEARLISNSLKLTLCQKYRILESAVSNWLISSSYPRCIKRSLSRPGHAINSLSYML